jgi:antiviral helicase SLH1
VEKPPEEFQKKPTLSRKCYLRDKAKSTYLLQGYISWAVVEDFALVSDMHYVAQNSGRIVRALLEIVISRKWAGTSAVLMGMSKAIEKRLWPFDHPLKQFSLKQDVFYGLERWADDYSVSDWRGCLQSSSEAWFISTQSTDKLSWTLLNNFLQSKSRILCVLLVLMFSELTRTCVVLSRGAPSMVLSNRSGFGLKITKKKMILQLSYLLLRQSTDMLDVEFRNFDTRRTDPTFRDDTRCL